MIRNIVFDMGNVLRDYNPALSVAAFVADPRDAALIEAQVFGSPEWPRLDRGTLTYPEALEIWKSRLPRRLHSQLCQVVAHWHEYMPEIPGMAELAGGLKAAGYRLYLLSNASVRYTVFKESLTALRFMDGAVISAFYGCIKPEKEIYQILFDTYQIRPQESFFIDDSAANIAAGEALGMKGHVFDQRHIPALVAALLAAGVRVPEAVRHGLSA